MEGRIYLVLGIAIGMIVSGGTAVFAQSNTTGNDTDVGTAQELTQLTNGNSLANVSSVLPLNGTDINQTSNQTSNMSGFGITQR